MPRPSRSGDQLGERPADDSKQPEHVQVPRRVVAEVALLVESGWPDACQSLSPGREVADVDREAAQRHVDTGNEDAQHQTEDEERHEDRAGIEPPGQVEYPHAPSADGATGHQVRRPRWGCRVTSRAKVAVSIHRASDGSRTGRVAAGWVPYTGRAVAFAAAAVVLLALGIYLRTMLPSTGFWDTGEAQTVPPTLSIFHPTGFPTYEILGWLWTRLPFGEVAWHMNLLSAVSVATAAGFVTLIAGHLIAERSATLRGGAAAIAGASFAFASEPWENATRADVHAVNVLFVAIVVWLLLTWRAAERAGSRRAGGWLVPRRPRSASGSARTRSSGCSPSASASGSSSSIATSGADGAWSPCARSCSPSA